MRDFEKSLRTMMNGQTTALHNNLAEEANEKLGVPPQTVAREVPRKIATNREATNRLRYESAGIRDVLVELIERNLAA